MPNLTLLFLLLLLVATYLLALQHYTWDALLLLGIALVGWTVVLVRRMPACRRVVLHWRDVLPRQVAGQIRCLALALSALVALIARQPGMQQRDYTLLLMGWCVALGAFGATLLLPLLRASMVRERLTATEWRALAGLLLMASLARWVALGTIPANLGGDEGTQLLAGLRLVQRPLGNPFATGWFSVPTLSFLAYGAAMRLFGATIAGGRALSALVGTLTVLTTFWLARAMGGRRAGWVAAVIVGLSSYHIHFSRLASNQIFDPLIATLTLALVWLAMEHATSSPAGSLAAWGLAGVVAGVGWYAYFGARWVSFIVALIVGWRALFDRQFLRQHFKGVLLFGLACLLVALPLLAWYTAHPDMLSSRYNQVSIFASGWLEREVEITGRAAPQLLLEQFWKSATAFHITRDPTFWYYPQMPLVDFITGALLLLGLVAAMLRPLWLSRGITLIWYWSTLIMAWVMTENPPSSQRGLLMVPAVALLVAWGVESLVHVFRRHRDLVNTGLVALTGMIVVINLGFYFGVYTPRRVYGNPTAEIATEVARFTQTHPPPGCAVGARCETPTYFFGPPQIYWDFGTLAFLLRDYPGVNVFPGELPQVAAPPARFVLVPARFDDLRNVQAHYAGGYITRILSPDQRLLAIIYDWPGEAR